MRFRPRVAPGGASSKISGGIVVAAALALGVACSAAPPRTAATGETVVQVTERDFEISAPRSVTTGNLLLRVTNKGPDSHELIIVRRKGQLPLRRDGFTVDEEALQEVTVGVLEPGGVGVRDLRLHVTPGRYQFLCNMAGHYMAGMFGDLEVR
jgi:uncharacterized cupredoxin-like copper-binding protein